MQPSIYFVRHAETAMNTGDKLVRGWTDVPLNADGQKETQRLAQQFQGVPLHYVLASPLQRSQATAQALSQATGARVVTSPLFMPWNTGVYTGRTEAEAKPDLTYAMDHPNEEVEGGEAYNTFYNRNKEATKGLMDLVAQHPNTGVAVVSHSRNIATLPSILSDGKEAVGYGSPASPPPSSITRVVMGPQGWTIDSGEADTSGDDPAAFLNVGATNAS